MDLILFIGARCRILYYAVTDSVRMLNFGGGGLRRFRVSF